MARKHEDERFRLALQRLSNNTGVPLHEADDWETRSKIANDSNEPTYRARVTKIMMTNEHGEEEELFRGTKVDVTAQLNVMNRLLECSKYSKAPKIPILLNELPKGDIKVDYRKREPLQNGFKFPGT